MSKANNRASPIWNIANIVKNSWRRYKYHYNTLLPFVLLKHPDNVLAVTKDKVFNGHQGAKNRVSTEDLVGALNQGLNAHDRNVDRFDYKKLLDDTEEAKA